MFERKELDPAVRLCACVKFDLTGLCVVFLPCLLQGGVVQDVGYSFDGFLCFFHTVEALGLHPPEFRSGNGYTFGWVLGAFAGGDRSVLSSKVGWRM